MSIDLPELKRRARKLGLFGLFAKARRRTSGALDRERTGVRRSATESRQSIYFAVRPNLDEVADAQWVEWLLRVEEEERRRRSLERRLRFAAIGRFKPMADFDWQWPKEVDREAIDELFTFAFLSEKANVVLAGPNGVGKSMISKNLAYQALLRGHRVLFTTASAMLNGLATQDGSIALQRKLKYYCGPELLIVDELGYLSYDNRHADLLFEIVTRRYEQASTVITTNKPFSDWNQVFPNAACVVTLVDRLVHRAEILSIDGESYRLKEANERKAKHAKRRRGAREPTP